MIHPMPENNSESMDTQEQYEIAKIAFLRDLTGSPEVFLAAQQELLFGQNRSLFSGADDENDYEVRPRQLEAVDFALDRAADHVPRILNIGSVLGDDYRNIAVNVSRSEADRPSVIADIRALPFRDDVFSVVRATHLLQHLTPDDVSHALQELRRVHHHDGELHVTVPNAEVVFDEIATGYTADGSRAYALDRPTEPLTQVYGRSYANHDPHDRRAHKIIFDFGLLKHFLEKAQYEVVERYSADQDLAYICGSEEDAHNRYSLLVRARHEKSPHTIEQILTEQEFKEKCRLFKEKYPDAVPASFIIPVHNEAKNLPHFLTFLEAAQNQTETKREFIFVTNGCTDDSEEIIQRYVKGSSLDMRLIHSAKGILPAFIAGIQSRSVHGFIGKLDADTILHPHALDLMHMHLVETPEAQVTYSEPMPLDSQTEFNEAEHNPLIRSRRLYLHGRASLYRDSPANELKIGEARGILKAEDIFMSFFYTYFYGFGAISRAPHALVYGRTASNYEELVSQASRSKSEITRILRAFPPFSILRTALDREVYAGDYRKVTNQVQSEATSDIQDWTRLEGTK